MSKYQLYPTLADMERRLGYTIDSLNYPSETVTRFYSDLRPVPDCAYKKTRRELDEHERKRWQYDAAQNRSTFVDRLTMKFGDVQGTITITQRGRTGEYRFAVDVHYGFGLQLPLLFTEDEASAIISAQKVQPSSTHHAASILFSLPQVIREMIYDLALLECDWTHGDLDDFGSVNSDYDSINFARLIGDPSGFYFPLHKDLAVVRVNRQIRKEALPFAYRRTTFYSADIDDLTKLLIAMGKTGRDNIESLEFRWESSLDMELYREETPISRGDYKTLPALHVIKCVHLLKQCERLRSLSLCFRRSTIELMDPDAFKADPGIQALCSVRGIKKVRIITSHGSVTESLEQHYLAKWLKEEMGMAKNDV